MTKKAPVNTASTNHTLDRRVGREVTENELSAIQQEDEQSTTNTTISGRKSEKHHLAAAFKTGFN